MRMYDIIDSKRRGNILSQEEINFFVEGFTNGSIPDYQASALLMAICCNGMNEEETFALTNAMLLSGNSMDCSAICGKVVDKHSTGGVGDTATLILAPSLACCGVYVAKLSGRGLGFTGGTIDKLESIPHFNTALTEQKFIEVVNKVGCAVMGQTDTIAPADKKLYALRDVTATIDCMPLICSSIMSKKLASGAEVILLDVKYGKGAFMKTAEEALQLAQAMVKIGTKAGKKMGALVTDMNQPLSQKIGNSLEVISAIEVLRGKRNRLSTEVRELGAKLLQLSGDYDETQAITAFNHAIDSGAAYAKFAEMVRAQGGDDSYITNPSKFKLGRRIEVLSQQVGYVNAIAAQQVGNVLTMLGGGRLLKTDTIDNSVGIELNVQLGDYVQLGDKLATIFSVGKNEQECIQTLSEVFTITPTPPQSRAIAYAYVTAQEVKYY